MVRVDARVRAARTIAVDLATATVVRGLNAAGVRCILLKGPALASLLHDEGELRPYVDVDLLVMPDDERRASDVLRELGFEQLVDDAELGGHRRLHALEWRRDDSPSVDLHRTLPGARADAEKVVAVLAAQTQVITVAGEEVEALAPPALALQVALHAAHHGPLAPRVLGDLERAVERMPLGTWTEAAVLAGRIDATPALAAGLRLKPAGAAMADGLSLPLGGPVDVALRAGGAPPLAVGPDWLLQLPGPRAKLVLVMRTALPPPGARSGSGARSRGEGRPDSPPPTCPTRSGWRGMRYRPCSLSVAPGDRRADERDDPPSRRADRVARDRRRDRGARPRGGGVPRGDGQRRGAVAARRRRHDRRGAPRRSPRGSTSSGRSPAGTSSASWRCWRPAACSSRGERTSARTGARRASSCCPRRAGASSSLPPVE